VAINELVRRALPLLAESAPDLQYLHLTGSNDPARIQSEYAAHRRRAVVRPFLTEMELALGAATLALSRAGASCLAEFAAMELPSILIPYPHAADNHQLHNAQALVQTGAARQIDQVAATPELVAATIVDLLGNQSARASIQAALRKWRVPEAARLVAARMLARMGLPTPGPVSEHEPTTQSFVPRKRKWMDGNPRSTHCPGAKQA
jgi:UDP-N-acetylglucosamine--N-acetylmuramyl-(pentapeptide) pyrophosphoryl-undecaprenol N-acetylglucosamine transferase